MVDSALRTAALGRLFRGIAHELANSLNNITMNAELARLSPEDGAEALEKIANNGRDGGRFLKELSAFAAADEFTPGQHGSVHESIALARRLIVSRARRNNLDLKIDDTDRTAVPHDKTGLAVVLALLIDALCGRASKVSLQAFCESGHCTIVIDHDAPEISDEVALQLVTAMATGHGGDFQQSPQRLRIVLPT